MESKVKAKEAGEFMTSGYNCAQSVVLPFAEELGLSKENAAKVSCGFGGGMGAMQKICGAVTGAFMVIGLKHGMTEPGSQDKKAETYKRVKQFAEEYTQLCGSVNCRELLDHDITTPEGRAEAKRLGLFKDKCVRFVEQAAEIVEKYIS